MATVTINQKSLNSKLLPTTHAFINISTQKEKKTWQQQIISHQPRKQPALLIIQIDWNYTKILPSYCIRNFSIALHFFVPTLASFILRFFEQNVLISHIIIPATCLADISVFYQITPKILRKKLVCLAVDGAVIQGFRWVIHFFRINFESEEAWGPNHWELKETKKKKDANYKVPRCVISLILFFHFFFL